LMNDEKFKRSVPVDCVLHISDKMTNPNVRFELDIPTGDQEVKSFLKAATNSEEEMAQQILFLLVFNSFYPDPNQLMRSGSSGSGLETMGLAYASEFLSNQMSRVISQLSDDFDFEFSIRPGTNNTGEIYEGGVTTDWWNFYANYEVSPENAENVGDFTFEFKPFKSDKLKVKAFRRTNATYLSQYPYTQGVGLRFRENFNQLRDLFKREKTPTLRRDEDEEMPEVEELDYEIQTLQPGVNAFKF